MHSHNSSNLPTQYIVRANASELILNAIVQKFKPCTNIVRLIEMAEKCNLKLSEDQRHFLITVTAFNINARYDDYKMSF